MKKPNKALKASDAVGGSQQRRIVIQLRQSILDGTYAAGAKLPNQSELADHFQVSGFTVHRSLNQLAREGFIRKRPRLGTHVVDTPPHLTNLALVFAHDPASSKPGFNKFYQAFEKVAIAYQHDTERNIFRFHGVDSHTDSQDRQRLMTCLSTHQVAGIIFAFPPFELEGSPILESPGIPRVALAAQQKYPHVPTVTTNGHSFIDRALDYLVARGRKRIAMLMVPGYEGKINYLNEALAKRGLESPPHWRLILSQMAPEGARNCVRLLMHDRPETRPDGLIIFDDNLVEEAQAGLIASGVRVPDDLEVVEHCNFPWTKSVLSTHRLGFDSNQILLTCIDLIDRQRKGETVPGQTLVPAIFEDEIEVTPLPQGHNPKPI